MRVSKAVVFAGGKSSRMGRDKALLPFDGCSTMAEYQYTKLQTIFDEVYISTKDNKFDFDARLILDRYDDSSPMVALASIGEILKNEALFILSVDTPFVNQSTILSMLCRYEESPSDILIAKSPNGNEPLCAIYSPKALQMAKYMLEQNIHRLHSLMQSVDSKSCHFDDSDVFRNLNTMAEYNQVKGEDDNES